LRDDLDGARRAVCVGGSYIGCEVAASLTELGLEVVVLLQEDDPLAHHFGPAAGRRVRAVLEAHGVEVAGGETVDRFEGDERVAAVHTASGRRVEADVVVCGVGAIPDVMLARRSGLELGPLGGVRCDSRLRAQGAPGLLAAGDMCEFDSVLHGACPPASSTRRWPRRRARPRRGRCSARTARTTWCPTSSPTSATGCRSSTPAWGAGRRGGRPRRRSGGGPAAIWRLAQGRVVGMLSVDGGGDLGAARELVARGEPVGAAGLPA
jgi:3-phenylpropionate/trans-cinnamate dioxygenase ferredoxin reductase subunit